MGAAAGSMQQQLKPPFQSIDAALAAGKSQQEIDAWLSKVSCEESSDGDGNGTIRKEPDSEMHGGDSESSLSLPDPWRDVPLDDQLRFVLEDVDGKSPVSIVIDGTETNGKDEVAVHAELEAKQMSCLVPLRVVIEETEAVEVNPEVFSPEFNNSVVSLVYQPSGALESFCVSAAETVLRHINLSGSPLSKADGFAFSGCSHVSGTLTPSTNCLWRLLSLDLSFSEIRSIDAVDFSGLCNLQQLALESCSLTTLNYDASDDSRGKTPFAFLSKTLQILNLCDNELSESDHVEAALRSLSASLTELDMRDNDIRDELGSKAYTKLLLTEIFPNAPGSGAQLLKLDNKHTGRSKNSDGEKLKTVAPLSRLDGIADAVGGQDEVVAANEDRGNCSCLEGNPCVEKYCCKDWKNRFKIAAAVRKMKGMESLPGD